LLFFRPLSTGAGVTKTRRQGVRFTALAMTMLVIAKELQRLKQSPFIQACSFGCGGARDNEGCRWRPCCHRPCMVRRPCKNMEAAQAGSSLRRARNDDGCHCEGAPATGAISLYPGLPFGCGRARDDEATCPTPSPPRARDDEKASPRPA